ncbi:glycosyltransferase [Zunongwangia sp. F363]|uniref:Glycosyltransferase n=1 Tax=Autumnicola tepida TaxID=3075595 RepID=A0ABU3C7J6_9FLAO|nr:glycosyltransferase [Zunongwangia sp. F363]MDT0642311.1 glycosyltransferase [Zunongwangia sp. F363]
MMDFAPICLFTFNRLEETKTTVESLSNNLLSSESELFVFSDGPRNDIEKLKVQEVRDYLREINGFKKIEIYESEINKGLAKSIIEGVSKIIEVHGKVIVVEDDLILSKNFLSFMNQSLNEYANTEDIFSVSGFSFKIKPPKDYSLDAYVWGRAHSWGWATWNNRWGTIDWEIRDFEKFKIDKKLQREFNKYGSDLSNMLLASMEGRVDSWFIRFTYNQFKKGKYTVFPVQSKVVNNGFMQNATHTNTYNRIKVLFDESEEVAFNFPKDISIDSTIGRSVYRYKSLGYRITGKFLTILMKVGLIKQRKTTI